MTSAEETEKPCGTYPEYPEYIQNTAKYTQAAKQKENQSVGKSAPEKRGLFVTTLYLYLFIAVFAI